MKQIRVLVVDDSAFLRRNLPRILEMDPEIKVIGTAANGREAIEMTKKLHPDVITLDVIMPVMDGLTALRHIMREAPTPVLMLSSVTYEGAKQTMEALSLGAVDYIAKPSGPISLDISKMGGELIRKVKATYTARVKAAARVNVASDKFKKIISDLSTQPSTHAWYVPDHGQREGKKELVAIAASTGGPAALQVVMGGIPSDLPVGVVMVQHIAEGFSQAFAERLNSISPLEIRVANDREMVRPGLGLLAPSGQHLTVYRAREKLYVALGREPADSLHRPSADVLFSSVARSCGPGACAVIMTGMGRDGAEGIKKIRDRGGATIAQDEATSIIFGMPKEAIKMGGIETVAPLEKISDEIVKTL